MNSIAQPRDHFQSPRNNVSGAYPMHLWLSDTGNRIAQDQARKEFVDSVDAAYDSVEGSLLSNGAVRGHFLNAVTPKSAGVHVEAAVRSWTRVNKVVFGLPLIDALTQAITASLWEVWRDEKAE